MIKSRSVKNFIWLPQKNQFNLFFLLNKPIIELKTVHMVWNWRERKNCETLFIVVAESFYDFTPAVKITQEKKSTAAAPQLKIFAKMK